MKRALFAILLAVAPAAAADDVEIAKGLENLRRIIAIAQELDIRLALGTGAPRLQLQRDPWGTVYRIDLGDGYQIAGAGSDAKFDESTWKSAVQFAGTEGDVVFKNGLMVRTNRNWLYANVTQGQRSAQLLAALRQNELLFAMMRNPIVQKLNAVRLTSVAIEKTAAAVDAYRKEKGSLAGFTLPLDARDAWGTPLRVVVDGDTYRVVSAGGDRLFDDESWSRAPSADVAEDVIYANGAFTRLIDPRAVVGETALAAQPFPQPPDPPFEGPAGQFRRLHSAMTAPVPVERIEPEYPEDYRRARVSGIVIMELAITEAGAVEKVRLLKSIAPELDMAAMKAVRQWKFRPAAENGQPVAVLWTLTVNFKLN